MNKRIAAVLLSAVICMGSLTACGMGGEVSSAVSGTESGSASSALTPKAESEVADSLDGLAEFMLTRATLSARRKPAINICFPRRAEPAMCAWSCMSMTRKI